MEQTKEIGIALNTRERHELMACTLFLLLFTLNPDTLHATKNESIHPGSVLTPAQTLCA